ncbi:MULTISPECIES: M20 metallopeptidase family protein [Reichenbachiella]|uniref:M20 metallopeptidase family protein n=1 Tax=Reichenbachiella TaxID=156993 RepID=UPI000E6C1A19|nr:MULTISPECIES: M20 family metallopeptidase [Reichenbachiella]MBU2914970.1 amidohydrolase [Reichenbachiella agariperforans]RJE70401.1 N-acyl-L-amino acid amidohydrolase [Reichenbachiella sp. MSK19-1]
MDLINKIKSLSSTFHEDTIANRRHLHAYPELSFEETETAAYIIAFLEKIGVKYKSGIAGNGIEAIVEGKNPEKKITALRGDMDALPIKEESLKPYKSTKPGIMHACGHDVHTSSLMTCLRIIHELRDQFEGTVKFIFQPGEEVFPGGASLMIKEGILKNPKPTSIFGQHVMPLIPVGKVGFRKGMYMASADEIYVTVRGKGGHGALPELCVDTVLIASHIIVALQQVVSRMASPKTPSVLTFGKVEAMGATNVIPSEVKIEGTFRTLDEKWRKEAHVRMKKLAEGLAESMGGFCDFNIQVGYPFLKNEPELTERARQSAISYLGEENVVDLDVWMGAEDFAYYSQKADACFYRLGTRNEEKNIISAVHTSTFDIDEEALELGPGLMAWIALNELSM